MVDKSVSRARWCVNAFWRYFSFPQGEPEVLVSELTPSDELARKMRDNSGKSKHLGSLLLTLSEWLMWKDNLPPWCHVIPYHDGIAPWGCRILFSVLYCNVFSLILYCQIGIPIFDLCPPKNNAFYINCSCRAWSFWQWMLKFSSHLSSSPSSLSSILPYQITSTLPHIMVVLSKGLTFLCTVESFHAGDVCKCGVSLYETLYLKMFCLKLLFSAIDYSGKFYRPIMTMK